MALIDRYTRHALWMAAFQIVVFLVVLVYALLPVSLGSHVLAPGALMVLAFAALVWITLDRPWDLEWEDGEYTIRVYGWVRCPPVLLVAVTLGIAGGFWAAFTSGKEQLASFRGVGGVSLDTLTMHGAGDAQAAWNVDAFGVLLTQGPNFFTVVFLPLGLLAFLWFLLP